MTLSSIAFLFPGQGSQAVGMGKELANLYPVARQTFEEADEALGMSISRLCFEGPEDDLKMTEITQPAILTMSIAVQRVLQEKGITPQFAAGHSLGEYSAHVAAGTFSFADAVRTVRNRGKYMQQAVPAGQGGMAAILGMDLAQVESVCVDAAQAEVVAPANINSPEQVAISGHQTAVQRAADLAKERGAKKAVILKVSAPFHCTLMQPAQDHLTPDLNALKFNDPRIPVIANVDAEPKTSGEAARNALIRQVTGAVQWTLCMKKLIALGVQRFIEVGPGKALTGLMRQIDRSQNCLNVENETTLQNVLNSFEAALKQ